MTEILMECDYCAREFYGPALQFLEEFYYRVELAARFCSVKCADLSVEERFSWPA